MKKKRIDISQVASSLRGESVFFPAKQENISEEENVNSSTHQQIDISPYQHVDTSLNQFVDKTADQHINKSTHQQTSKKLKRFGSYLTPESLKELKRIAFETDKKDYEVLQEAVNEFLDRLKK